MGGRGRSAGGAGRRDSVAWTGEAEGNGRELQGAVATYVHGNEKEGREGK